MTNQARSIKRKAPLRRVSVVVASLMSLAVITGVDGLGAAESPESLLGQARRASDRKRYAHALQLLRQAEQLDPGRYTYRYEMALVQARRGKYAGAAVTLMKVIREFPNAPAHVFELAGNTLGLSGKRDQGERILEQGLARFPSSGRLYAARGLLEARRGNAGLAVGFWKRGTELDPGHASNHYYLCRLYAVSTEKVWSLIYGEYFMNIERGTRRTMAISRILYKTYQNAVQIPNGGTPHIAMTRKKNVRSFEGAYESVYRAALPRANIARTVSIASLNRLRTAAVAKRGRNPYGFITVRWQYYLKQSGHYTAYNYWLLSQGNPKEFRAWYQENKKAYRAFLTWFARNRMRSEPLRLVDLR